MAFLRQLIEDGSGTVVVNNRDKTLLYDKEIQEQKLLKAAMKMSPDDGEALLYIGSFSKKVFDKRKPRPRDILSPAAQSSKDPLKGLQLPCDKILPLDFNKAAPVANLQAATKSESPCLDNYSSQERQSIHKKAFAAVTNKETGDIRSFRERQSNLEVIPASVREGSASH